MPGNRSQKANVQIYNETSEEIEYTLPVSGGDKLSPKVFDKKATYTVTLRNPSGKILKTLKGQRAK